MAELPISRRAVLGGLGGLGVVGAVGLAARPATASVAEADFGSLVGQRFTVDLPDRRTVHLVLRSVEGFVESDPKVRTVTLRFEGPAPDRAGGETGAFSAKGFTPPRAWFVVPGSPRDARSSPWFVTIVSGTSTVVGAG